MLSSQEKVRMMQSYLLLYEVENSLRDIIKSKMLSEYGHDWFELAPLTLEYPPPHISFQELCFPQYESHYLRIYPVFSFSPLFYKQLRVLYPLRNKVAHNHCISHYEFIQIQRSGRPIVRTLSEKKGEGVILNKTP